MSAGNILITGANGFLGGKIAREIINNTKYNVLAVASSREKVVEMEERENIKCSDRIDFCSNEDFFRSDTILENIYGAVHLAFSRRVRPASEIAGSLQFASRVFHRFAECRIDRVINMSSQGIYGGTENIRTENTPPAPETHYTMAKYAAEILFNDIMRDCGHYTNMRLDLVTQSQNIIKVLCRQAKEGQLHLKGGKQCFSFIDGKDAASAVVALLQTEGGWKREYNVGWNRRRYTLIELADIIADVAAACGYPKPEIILDKQDISLWAGMDSSRFMDETGWKPTIRLKQTIIEMLKA